MPPCLAAVPSPGLPEWNFARLSAFEALCADAGVECRVFDGKRNEDPALRIERLARWLSALPRRSGVFGTNDNAARDVVDAALRIPRHIPKELVVGCGQTLSPAQGEDCGCLTILLSDSFGFRGRLPCMG